MLPNDFIHIYDVMKRMEEENESVYIVGGAIRNYLLQKEINDIDLTTSANPEKIASIFPNVVDIASDHGTVLIIHDGSPYEITTYRTNECTIESDLLHRDFTMNALAMNKEGVLIDHHQGVKHIREKRIVPVGEASDRIVEDPLRILRAFRFVSELGFSVSNDLLESMKNEVNRLEEVATERILQEWTKLIKGNTIREAFIYMEKMALPNYLPLIQEDPNMIHHILSISEPFTNLEEFVAFMVIKEPTYKVQDWVKHWKMSNETRQNAKRLVHYYEDYRLHSLHDVLIYDVEEKLVGSFIKLLHKLDLPCRYTKETWIEKRKSLPIQSRSEIAINGHDLIQLFPQIRVGSWLGHMLRRIEVAIIERQLLNNKKAIKEWIQCHPPVND